MTTATLYPALDTIGWTNAPIQVVDQQISHFFLSDYSQTENFPGQVRSFSWILYRHQGNIEQICTETELALTALFSTMFSNVSVSVTYRDDASSINVSNLIVSAAMTDAEGTILDLNRILKYQDLRILGIFSALSS